MTDAPVRYRRIPFLDHLGARVVRIEPGQVEIVVEIRPELCNSGQVAHGGVSMAVLDAALSIAARASRSTDPASPLRSVTIEMKTTFLRPGTGVLRAIGRCVHATASLGFCEGELLNAAGEPVARASGTFKLVSPRSDRPEPPSDG